MVNDESYVVIKGWMVTKLGLKGTELMVYAIIYGFSQDGQTKFKGSQEYLAEFCGVTRQSIINALNSLINKNLIELYKHGNVCEYSTSVKIFDSECATGVKNFDSECKKILQESVKKFDTRCKNFLHNNIVYNIDNNNINNNIDQPTTKKTTEKQEQYADFVKMKPSEHDKLIAKYGEKPTAEMIEILNNYKGASGKKYKSDYLAILNWVVDRWQKECKNKQQKDYSYSGASGYDPNIGF